MVPRTAKVFDAGTFRRGAREAGLDPIMVKVTISCWRGPRTLRPGSDRGIASLRATSGLPAG
eukprot:2367594-Pyramimonas_sp.AAC.1